MRIVADDVGDIGAVIEPDTPGEKLATTGMHQPGTHSMPRFMIKGLGDLAAGQHTEVGAFTLILIPSQLLGEPCTQKGTLTIDVIALLHQHHIRFGIANYLEDLLRTLGHFISAAPGIPDEHLEYVRIFRRPDLGLLLQRQI